MLTAVLQKDVTISLDKLVPLVTTFEAGTSDPKPVAFWTRTTIRCLMGLIDGLSFSMRQAVLKYAKDAGLAFSPNEKENLKDHHLRTLDSFKLAFRTFPRLFGSEYTLNTGGEEGTISAAGFFIDAGAQRGKVTLSAADRTSLSEGEIEDRFVAACNVWAREFRNDYVLDKTGPNWKHLRGARAFRNRITHPKGPGSLRVDLAMMDTLLGAHSFYMDGWEEGLSLDLDKWIEREVGIDEVIAKEKARAQEDAGPET